MDDGNVVELDAGNDKSGEYKVEAIWDNAVYTRELESSYLSGLYYLISWKRYSEKKNTWEPTLAVQHLWKLLSKYHHKNPDKPTATTFPIDTALPMAKPTVKLPAKQKWEQPIRRAKKRSKTR